MKPKHHPPEAADALHDEDPCAWLSALADGDVRAEQRACSLWRDDEQARRRWHAYHLIGDVMRSDELASAPARDAAFVAGLRARLAAEPVVLTPTPARWRQPWLLPAAAAAGFAVVAGALAVARIGSPGVQPPAAVVAGGGSEPVASLQAPQRVDSQMLIRDARLDEYVRLHEAARRGVVMPAPGGTLLRPVVVPPSLER